MTSQGSKIEVQLEPSQLLPSSDEHDGCMTIALGLNTERKGKYARPKFTFTPYLNNNLRETEDKTRWNATKDTLSNLHATYADFFRSFEFSRINTEDAMVDDDTKRRTEGNWIRELRPAMLAEAHSTLAHPESIRVTLGNASSVLTSMGSNAVAGRAFAVDEPSEQELEPSDPEKITYA